MASADEQPGGLCAVYMVCVCVCVYMYSALHVLYVYIYVRGYIQLQLVAAGR